jgi:hypothetical protein
VLRDHTQDGVDGDDQQDHDRVDEISGDRGQYCGGQQHQDQRVPQLTDDRAPEWRRRVQRHLVRSVPGHPGSGRILVEARHRVDALLIGDLRRRQLPGSADDRHCLVGQCHEVTLRDR